MAMLKAKLDPLWTEKGGMAVVVVPIKCRACTASVLIGSTAGQAEALGAFYWVGSWGLIWGLICVCQPSEP